MVAYHCSQITHRTQPSVALLGCHNGYRATRDGYGDQVSPRALFAGLATLDVVHHLEAHPGPDQKVTALRQFVAAGGPAANAAVTFAALGGVPTLVTAIGAGPVGLVIRRELEARGVEIIDAAPGDYEPPVSAVGVVPATGTRSVTSADARGSAVSADAAIEAALAAGPQAVLVDGHHAGLARAAAATARAADVSVILDAGRWKPVMADLLPLATAVIASADFRLPEYAGDPRGGDLSSSALVARGVPVVASTHGPDSVRWWFAGESGSLPVKPMMDADSLGAGDAFHGAYVFASLTKPGGPVNWLSYAATVAALKCSVPGPRAWLDRLAQWQASVS